MARKMVAAGSDHFLEVAVDYDNMLRSDIERIEKILPREDIVRLINMQAIYVSNEGKLLAHSDEERGFCLVEKLGNGFIPLHAVFPSPFSSLLNRSKLAPTRFATESTDTYLGYKSTDYVRGELSMKLSNYIWPSYQDVVWVQFKSMYDFYPTFNRETKVVFGVNGGGDDGKYSLAASRDGTVKWRRQSRCRNGSHIWAVHLFDPALEGDLHISQRLRRRGMNVQSGTVINNHIGANINGPGGTQNIGSANVHI